MQPHRRQGWQVHRKSNGKYRFCIDFRELNAVTKAYPLPQMDAILRKLQNARYISTIDLSSAYHQPMPKEAQQLTAFTMPGMGLFEFTRMPYGVVGGPATFQQLSDKIIGPEMEPHTCLLVSRRYYHRLGDVRRAYEVARARSNAH